MTNTVRFPGLGLSFVVDRVAFSIGSFPIYWYGVLIGGGMLLALLYAFRYAPRLGIDTDRMIDVIIVGTVMSIVCARAYYVAMAPFKYESVWQMLDIRDGGIAIYGAVIGAFLFGGLACRWRRVPVLPMFDLTAIGFLIGQAVGRWGNFVNQEAFGTNTTLPWGMISGRTTAYLASVQDRLAAEGVLVDPQLPVHPTFLYESLWCFLGFVLLALYLKRRRFNGEIILLYVIWYGLGRAWIEGLRTDSLYLVGSLRASQLIAIVSAAAALAAWLLLRKKYRGRPPLGWVTAAAEGQGAQTPPQQAAEAEGQGEGRPGEPEGTAGRQEGLQEDEEEADGAQPQPGEREAAAPAEGAEEADRPKRPEETAGRAEIRPEGGEADGEDRR